MEKNKFIVACLEQIQTKEELEFIWNTFLTTVEIQSWQIKTGYLKEAMGGDKVKYFDVPKEPEQEYLVIEMMFLSGNWKYGQEIDKLKTIVEAL